MQSNNPFRLRDCSFGANDYPSTPPLVPPPTPVDTTCIYRSNNRHQDSPHPFQPHPQYSYDRSFFLSSPSVRSSPAPAASTPVPTHLHQFNSTSPPAQLQATSEHLDSDRRPATSSPPHLASMFSIWSEGFGTDRDSIELALFFARSQRYYNTAEVSVAAWKAKSVLETVLEAAHRLIEADQYVLEVCEAARQRGFDVDDEDVHTSVGRALVMQTLQHCRELGLDI